MTNEIIGNLVAIIIVLALLVYCYYKGKKKIAYQIILSLVLKAEKIFGSGTGDIKYTYVVSNAYAKLPSIVKLFISEKELDNFIEKSVEQLENYLKNQFNLICDNENGNTKE